MIGLIGQHPWPWLRGNLLLKVIHMMIGGTVCHHTTGMLLSHKSQAGAFESATSCGTSPSVADSETALKPYTGDTSPLQAATFIPRPKLLGGKKVWPPTSDDYSLLCTPPSSASGTTAMLFLALRDSSTVMHVAEIAHPF